jgi:hypothetical protein
MKNFKNSLIACSMFIVTLLSGLFTINQCFAQGMYIPVRSTIHTPYGNHTITTPHYQHMPWMYGNGGAAGPYTPVYEFTVVLKNDSTFKVKGQIMYRDSSVHYLALKGKEKKKIYVSETKQIWRKGQTGQLYTGVATDTCWLFQVVKGAINGYTFVSDPNNAQYTTAIQKGDSKIVPLTSENLLSFTGTDDAAIVKLVKAKKLAAALKAYNKKEMQKAKAEKKKS